MIKEHGVLLGGMPASPLANASSLLSAEEGTNRNGVRPSEQQWLISQQQLNEWPVTELTKQWDWHIFGQIEGRGIAIQTKI